MAYSGKYSVINKSKYKGDANGVIYRSLWEKHTFAWCDKNPKIKWWCSEEIVVPYYWEIDKRYHRYFVDLQIAFTSGDIVLVEIKPKRQTLPPKGTRKTKSYLGEAREYVKNMNKWEAAETYAKDRNWHFQIWTEFTLQKMGIMKKQLKPIKPLKRL
jgi:hypothetical protein|tara:strand:+ start:1444 stop:1914 length:471 start_codon:yes stop_codon:yes gene_type:complete